MAHLPSTFISTEVKDLAPLDIPGLIDPNNLVRFDKAIKPVVQKILDKYGIRYLFASHEGETIFYMFGGLSFVFVITNLGLPQVISEFIINLSPNRWVTLISINILLLVLGCMPEPIGMLVITLPFLFPTLAAEGFDPIWLGVLLTVNVETVILTLFPDIALFLPSIMK